MSWSIYMVGKASAVADAVDKEQYLPQPLKDMVRLLATEAEGPNGSGGLSVESNGHHGGGYEGEGGGVNTFRCIICKFIACLMLFASLALVQAQVNTNPPPSGINGLENTVFGYFTAFNTNLVTFRLNRFDLWTGATAMQGSSHPLLNDLAGSYDLWRPTPSTSSAVQTAISLECVTRNEGVMGSLISVQGGIGLSAILWDVKTTLYLDGGSYLDPLAVGEHWDSRLFGEVGVRFKKALGQNFYAGVGLGAQFPKNNQLLSAFAGLTF